LKRQKERSRRGTDGTTLLLDKLLALGLSVLQLAVIDDFLAAFTLIVSLEDLSKRRNELERRKVTRRGNRKEKESERELSGRGAIALADILPDLKNKNSDPMSI